MIFVHKEQVSEWTNSMSKDVILVSVEATKSLAVSGRVAKGK